MGLFLYAFRNLRRNKLRLLLTLLGVGAGFAILATSFSITGNFRDQISDIVDSARIDIMVQSKQAPTPITSRISDLDYENIQGIQGISDTSSMVLGSLRTPFAPYFLLMGISTEERMTAQIKLLEGRWFVPGKQEIMLGQLAAIDLGYKVGEKIVLAENMIYTITGIYSFGYKMTDSSAAMHTRDAQFLLNRDNSVNMVFIQTESSQTQTVINKINTDFPHLYASAGGDMVSQIRLFDSFDLFAWLISGASFITCCLIVMNTLVMAVTERKKELSILLAIGWSGFMVYRTVLYEGIIISITGCILGLFFGATSLHLLQSSRHLGMGLIPISIPLEVVIQAFSIAVLLGLVSSFYPAILSTKVYPAQALRQE